MGNISVRRPADRGEKGKRRDSRGRFVTGISGNPAGRPSRKKEVPLPPDFLSALVAIALEEREVSINGKLVSITMIELIIRKMMNDALKSNGYQCARIVSLLQNLGALKALEEKRREAERAAEEKEFVWTEEMEQKMQMLERLVTPPRKTARTKGKGDPHGNENPAGADSEPDTGSGNDDEEDNEFYRGMIGRDG